jgi:hypothetical protein
VIKLGNSGLAAFWLAFQPTNRKVSGLALTTVNLPTPLSKVFKLVGYVLDKSLDQKYQ